MRIDLNFRVKVQADCLYLLPLEGLLDITAFVCLCPVRCADFRFDSLSEQNMRTEENITCTLMRILRINIHNRGKLTSLTDPVRSHCGCPGPTKYSLLPPVVHRVQRDRKRQSVGVGNLANPFPPSVSTNFTTLHMQSGKAFAPCSIKRLSYF